MTTLSKIYVGVDVSKNNLDVFIHPLGKHFRIMNSKAEIKDFIKKILSLYDVANIACEATGGYEKALQETLKKHSYDLWIVDPRRIKGFILASGCKSKTDKIDAQKIAEFAEKQTRDYDVIYKTENQKKLQAFVNRKHDLRLFLVAEKTRVRHPSHAASISSIKKIIQVLEKEVARLEKQISELIDDDIELTKKAAILESVPGIGRGTSAVLLSFVPELGQISEGKASSLIGVVPYARESGNYKGKGFIQGGRIIPRNALYMCALSAKKHYPPIKEFFDRLTERKKPFKVAMVAVMHKLVIISSSLLRKGELCRI